MRNMVLAMSRRKRDNIAHLSGGIAKTRLRPGKNAGTQFVARVKNASREHALCLCGDVVRRRIVFISTIYGIAYQSS